MLTPDENELRPRLYPRLVFLSEVRQNTKFVPRGSCFIYKRAYNTTFKKFSPTGLFNWFIECVTVIDPGGEYCSLPADMHVWTM